jgi:hypothetical protein
MRVGSLADKRRGQVTRRHTGAWAFKNRFHAGHLGRDCMSPAIYVRLL